MKSEDFSWLKNALSGEFPRAKIIIRLFERGTSSYLLDELGGHSLIRQIGIALRIDGKAYGARFPIEQLNKDGSIQDIDFSDPTKRESIIHDCLVVFLPMERGRTPRPIYQNKETQP